MDIEEVNSVDFGEFVDVFGNVIERCPLIAAAVWSQRPFSDLENLEKHFFAFSDALPQSGLLQEVFRPWRPAPFNIKAPLRAKDFEKIGKAQAPYRVLAHCLAGRKFRASAAALTPLGSSRPKVSKDKPVTLCAALLPRSRSGLQAVPLDLARRLHCPPAQELCTALGEVKKLSHLLLADLFSADPARL
ncbi:putative 2-oxo-4-hydroxy-4-carboxy-5-ureidoimidazoline decarboxylase [Fukomys damarensis]|uniref:putative 2-oxo-4-hydroxy-4-carboxy-5-ureidoimidazoline decarboxylase n=1 Tax=Fukomys damarensis TaxID=885580 RepID=UPI00053F796A|nr:putative 2-oxo-4-hydroxy-4-carboxy-5-ureidoimidazoline decarboxylase [Fukomys damarensis]